MGGGGGGGGMKESRIHVEGYIVGYKDREKEEKETLAWCVCSNALTVIIFYHSQNNFLTCC